MKISDPWQKRLSLSLCSPCANRPGNSRGTSNSAENGTYTNSLDGMEGHRGRQLTQSPHLGLAGVECIFQTF